MRALTVMPGVPNSARLDDVPEPLDSDGRSGLAASPYYETGPSRSMAESARTLRGRHQSRHRLFHLSWLPEIGYALGRRQSHASGAVQ